MESYTTLRMNPTGTTSRNGIGAKIRGKNRGVLHGVIGGKIGSVRLLGVPGMLFYYGGSRHQT